MSVGNRLQPSEMVLRKIQHCAIIGACVLAVAAFFTQRDRQYELASVSPLSAKWTQASSADSSFLDSRKPSVDEIMDAQYKHDVALQHHVKTAFIHGHTRISLGPAAVRAIADGADIKWPTPLAPEVQQAYDAAGSIERGFGGGNTMRPRMRISPTVRRMVNDDKASVGYREGESPEPWADPTTGSSFAISPLDAQRGAYMKWKNKKKSPVSRVPGGGGIQSDADKLHDKMEEMNQGYGGTGERYHMVIGNSVKHLVASNKASVHWRDHESPDNVEMGYQFVGRPGVSLGPHDVKRGAYIRPTEPMKMLQANVDRINAGYGGVGGRAHMVVGNVIKDLVRRNKASVDWRDGESASNPGFEHKFVGRPKVSLGPHDALVGAYMRPMKARADEQAGEMFRPRVTLDKKDVLRGSHAEWHDVDEDAEPEDKYSVVLPEFVGVRFNNYTVVGPKNLLSKERIAYHNNYTLKEHAPYTDPVDPCPPQSRCAMIKNLNKIHLAGVEHFGGKTWRPSLEASKNANWAKFDDQDADISMCQHCVTKFLADAGPARWIVGRSLVAQARSGTCAAFCEKNPTQNIPVAV